MQKHTPAPWTIREVRHSNVPGQRAFAIDFNEDQEQVVDWVYEEADAKLIAAAPELLENLTNLVGLAKLGAARLDKYHAALASAEAIIAKATQ
ncbi:hypothetical protein [Pseudomonas gessardii]|uniref:hypothetical protein n=1 Tax=Pseudomonas gessardii TaxID=78544 RepID=UPI00147634B1|nr:hypothetical protein [Pseudomonas gessardii]NNA69452.1 hypothetical protein [Pseudomonas gessardii]